MELFYHILADVVVVAHFAYVVFVILGLIAVLVGRLRGWAWTRRFGFRAVHLAMIAIVVVESWFGITCPLTTWEKELRKLAGQATYGGDFVGRCLHDMLFVDLSASTLTLLYSVFGLVVLLSLVLSPPRWPERRPRSEVRG